MSIYTSCISNTLAVIQKIKYRLFLSRLNELQTLEKSVRTGKPIQRMIFPTNKVSKGYKYEDMHSSRLRNTAPAAIFKSVRGYVVPFLQTV